MEESSAPFWLGGDNSKRFFLSEVVTLFHMITVHQCTERLVIGSLSERGITSD